MGANNLKWILVSDQGQTKIDGEWIQCKIFRNNWKHSDIK